jgi:hypothetical protein
MIPLQIRDKKHVWPFLLTLCGKKRAKLSKVLGIRALKSFHPRLFNDKFFAGEPWSWKPATVLIGLNSGKRRLKNNKTTA